jgi:hypothetical protein
VHDAAAADAARLQISTTSNSFGANGEKDGTIRRTRIRRLPIRRQMIRRPG